MITKVYNRIKTGILWVKNNPKKALLTLIGISFVSAAPLLFPGTTEENKNDILPLTFNDQVINFPYTDDNTGETLIIKTDQETYSSWDSAYVYFAVKNITNDDQDTKIQFAYDGGANTSKIEEFKPQVPYQVEVPDYQDKTYECKSGWEVYNSEEDPFENTYICKGDPKTVRYCSSVEKTTCTVLQEQIGTHFETRYKDEWGNIAKAVVENLKIKDIKPIDSKFVAKEQVGYWIPAGATKYFRAKLVFSPKSNGEFYINAYGHLNAVGHLDPWYSSSWGYRRQITLDYTKVGTTTPITGIPLMFSTSTIDDLKDETNGGKVGKSDGTDILVTASDGTTKIPHELEFYSSSTGETVLHFISSTSTPLSTSTNTSYYLYYGNSGASDQQDVSNVWNSAYRAVFHLNEGDSTGAGFYEDSTTNGIDGTLTDADGDTSIGSGQIDGALDFAGDADYINVPDTNDPTAMTLSAWIRSNDITSTNAFIRTNSSGPTSAWSHNLGISATSTAIFYIYDTGAFGNNAIGTTKLSADTWYYLVGTTEGNGTPVRVYLNGVLEASSANLDASPWTGGDRWGIARNSQFAESGGPAHSYFDGILDEPRISTTARSASWILTEYNNQSSPNTFWSVGSEEQDTPAAAPSTSRRIINIE